MHAVKQHERFDSIELKYVNKVLKIIQHKILVISSRFILIKTHFLGGLSSTKFINREDCNWGDFLSEEFYTQ